MLSSCPHYPATSRADLEESEAMADYAQAWEKWFPLIERGAAELTACMLDSAGLEPGQRVLDIATGIGEPALSAARRVGAAGRVTGVDLSPAMLEFAAQRAAGAGLENIDFRLMDANALDLDTASFDAALCRWGLMFVDDLQRTLRAIHGALKPGARLAIGVWAAADEVPALSTAARVLHRELGLPPPPEGAGTAFALAAAAPLLAALQAAGFEQITRKPVNVHYDYASAQEYLAHRREVSNLLRESLASIDEPELERAVGVLERELEACRRADGSLGFDNRAYCVAATRA
jgi:SAM-dependent methyltransferase